MNSEQKSVYDDWIRHRRRITPPEDLADRVLARIDRSPVPIPTSRSLRIAIGTAAAVVFLLRLASVFGVFFD